MDCLPYLTFTWWIASLTWHLLNGLPPLPDIYMVDCLPYLTFTQWIASLTWHLPSGLPPLPDIYSVDCLPHLTFTKWIVCLSWHLLSGLLPLPDTKWTLHRHPQQGAGIPGEDITDLVPVDGGQEVGVGRVLDPLLQIQHAAHQDL